MQIINSVLFVAAIVAAVYSAVSQNGRELLYAVFFARMGLSTSASIDEPCAICVACKQKTALA
jgi:hypothetical protein